MRRSRAVLLDAQWKIEADAKAGREKRFDAAVESASKKGHTPHAVASGMAHAALKDLVNLYHNQKPTRGASAFKTLAHLDPVRICEVAAQVAFAATIKPRSLEALTKRIGERLEDELMWAKWDKKDWPEAKRVRARVKRLPGEFKQGKELRWSTRHSEKVDHVEWTDGQHKKVGSHFVNYLASAGYLERTSIQPRRKRLKVGKKIIKKKPMTGVQLTERGAQKVSELTTLLRESATASRPCVVRPVPWTATEGGGFHHRGKVAASHIPRPLRPLPFVKKASEEQRGLMERGDMGAVYTGVNALQSVAWRINRRVYEVAVKLFDEKGVPGIKFSHLQDPPPLGADAEKDWKKRRRHDVQLAEVKADNAAEGSRQLAFEMAVKVATDFVDFPAIYFVHQLDRRGSVYSVANYLSPQGDDIERGLLEFANGDRMTGDSERWLRIHLANCYGKDKGSFDDRVKWSRKNEARIIRCAADPHQHHNRRFWQSADGGEKRWQFLAACFAFADWERKGRKSTCRVPVVLDGSCSGLQHYSALTRDKETGRAVNLLPSEVPADFYQDVADEVMRILKASKEKYVRRWHAWKVTRKIVKGAVMVMPYGGVYETCGENVRSAVRKQGQPSWVNKHNQYDAHKVLVDAVWEAMASKAAAPREAMKWLRRTARQWGDQSSNVLFQWRAPTGFPVVCDLFKTVAGTEVEHDVWADGPTSYVQTWRLTKETNWNGVVTAVPPNFIHSLDASHLIFSVNRATSEGITQITTVHDAFGTTPARMGRLAQILREEFVKLYAPDQFSLIVNAAQKAGVKIDPPPSWIGDRLNIEDVAKAEYLFD